MRAIAKAFIAGLVLALPAMALAAETKAVPESNAASSILTGTPPTPAPAAEAVAQPKAPESAKAETGLKIGFADLVRIGNESVQGKAVQAKLKEKNEKFQAQITARQKQLEKQKSAVQAKLATLTPPQREAKAREFEKKVDEYQKLVRSAEKEMQSLQEELTGQLFKSIEQAANAYGKANGFAVIAVRKELLYLDSAVDVREVTDALLNLVDEKATKP